MKMTMVNSGFKWLFWLLYFICQRSQSYYIQLPALIRLLYSASSAQRVIIFSCQSSEGYNACAIRLTARFINHLIWSLIRVSFISDAAGSLHIGARALQSLLPLFRCEWHAHTQFYLVLRVSVTRTAWLVGWPAAGSSVVKETVSHARGSQFDSGRVVNKIKNKLL